MALFFERERWRVVQGMEEEEVECCIEVLQRDSRDSGGSGRARNNRHTNERQLNYSKLWSTMGARKHFQKQNRSFVELLISQNEVVYFTPYQTMQVPPPEIFLKKTNSLMGNKFFSFASHNVQNGFNLNCSQHIFWFVTMNNFSLFFWVTVGDRVIEMFKSKFFKSTTNGEGRTPAPPQKRMGQQHPPRTLLFVFSSQKQKKSEQKSRSISLLLLFLLLPSLSIFSVPS